MGERIGIGFRALSFILVALRARGATRRLLVEVSRADGHTDFSGLVWVAGGSSWSA